MSQFTYLSFKDVVTIGERGVHDEYAELGNAIDAESARKLTARLNELYTETNKLRDFARSLLQALTDLQSGYPWSELHIDIEQEVENAADLGIVLDDNGEEDDESA